MAQRAASYGAAVLHKNPPFQVKSRLAISRPNCYIAQRDEDGCLKSTFLRLHLTVLDNFGIYWLRLMI